MKLLCFFLAALSAWAVDNGLNLASAKIERTSLPGVTYNGNGDIRIEGRLEKTGTPALNDTVAFIDARGASTGFGYSLKWIGASTLQWISTNDTDAGAGTGINSAIGSATDLMITAQLVVSTKVLSLEVWNAATGASISAGSITLGTMGPLTRNGALIIGQASGASRLGTLRWYTSTVPYPSSFPAFDVTAEPQALWLKFDQANGNVPVDSRSTPLSLSITAGSPTYSTMQLYSPLCSAAAPVTALAADNPLGLGPVLRAGVANTLDGRGSQPRNGGLTLAYSWGISAFTTTQRPLLGSTTTSQPSVSGLTFGDFTASLTVTDTDSQSATCTATYGSVSTDSNGVVVAPPVMPTWMTVQMKEGGGPWNWLPDRASKFLGTQASLLASTGNTYDADWDTARGVFTLTNGSTTANFVSGDALTVPCAIGGRFLVIWANGGANRQLAESGTCTSGTVYTFSTPWTGTSGNYTWSYADCSGCWAGQGGNLNYYDLVTGFYLAYWRSGYSAYLTAARTLADRWWRQPWINQGGTIPNASSPPPRIQAYFGLVLRAIDLKDNQADGGARLTAVDAGLEAKSSRCRTGDFSDNREFSMNCVALVADYFAQPAGARKTQLLGYLQTALLSLTANRQTDGIYNWWGNYISLGASWNGDISGAYTVTNGSPNITVSGGGGTWPLAAGQPITFCTSIIPPTYVPDIACDSVAYVIQSSTSTTAVLDRAYQGTSRTTSTVTGLNGSASGVSGFGQQPFIHGIVSFGVGMVARAFEDAGDTTRRDLARGYLDQAATWNYTQAVDATPGRGLAWGVYFATCKSPVQTPPCSFGDQGGREMVSEILAGEAMAELLFPSSARRTKIDNMAGAKFGFITPCPGCDGTYETGLANATGRWSPAGAEWQGGKWNGFYFGPFASPYSWPAARLGGLAAPDLRTYTWPVSLGTATSAVVRVIRPSGELVASAPCSSSACSIALDARQAGHLYCIEKRDSGGNRVGGCGSAGDYLLLTP